MPSRHNIQWWEPYRETVKSVREQLKTEKLWTARPWIRAWVASLLVGGLIIGAIRCFYPGTPLPWLQVLFVFLIGPPAIVILSMGQMFAPRCIQLRESCIFISHGQSSVRIDLDRLISVDVSTDGEGRRLNIRYLTKRGVERVRSIAVSDRVLDEDLQTAIEHYHQALAAPVV